MREVKWFRHDVKGMEEFPLEEKFTVITHPNYPPIMAFSKTSDHARLINKAIERTKMSEEEAEDLSGNNFFVNGGRVRHARQEVQFDAVPTKEHLATVATAMKEAHPGKDYKLCSYDVYAEKKTRKDYGRISAFLEKHGKETG